MWEDMMRPLAGVKYGASLAPAATIGIEPSLLSPADHIRDLVLEVGGVSEVEAAVLLALLEKLEEIERTEGKVAADQAARAVRQRWCAGATVPA
jgi:hypothetical protein